MTVTNNKTIPQLDDALPLADTDLLLVTQRDPSGKYLSRKAKVSNLRGKSAYQTALENGFSGTEKDWITSIIPPTSMPSSAIVDGDLNLTQDKINNSTVRTLESIADLSTIKNPKNGQTVYIKSYHPGLGKGGGHFVYDSTQSGVNDGGMTINGWKRQYTQVTPEMFGAKGDGVTDDSVSIQNALAFGSTNKLIVDGLNKTYACNNVIFDSYCHFKNAKLLNNKHDTDLISVLTTVKTSAWVENVTFENINIDGNRDKAINIKSQTTTEDGGRHGFRIVRPIRNSNFIRCSASYCAGDGIILFPDWSAGLFTSIKNVNIIDCEFSWNRRHGGSSDRVDGLTLRNTKCNYNGLPLPGYETAAANSGGRGDLFNGNYYGNGWDSEEYDDSQVSINLTFDNCEMIQNARGGLLILATNNAVAPSSPTNIKIMGGRYDKGVYNTTDLQAITITPNSLNNPNPVYKNTLITGVSCTDDIFLRNNTNYSVTNTPARLGVGELSDGYTDSYSGVSSNTGKVKQYISVPQTRYKYNEQSGGFDSFIAKTSYYTLTTTPFVNEYYFGSGIRGALKAEFNGNTGYVDLNLYNGGSATPSSTWQYDGSFLPAADNVASLASSTYRYKAAYINDLVTKPLPSKNPQVNGEMVFELTSNTQLKVKVKGSDGVVRSTILTLT